LGPGAFMAWKILINCPISKSLGGSLDCMKCHHCLHWKSRAPWRWHMPLGAGKWDELEAWSKIFGFMQFSFFLLLT
jgi:hypothetical protein